MLKVLEKYRKSINLVLLSIIILTYMFRDLRCVARSDEYMRQIVNIRNIVGIIMLVLFVINAIINRKYSVKTNVLIIATLVFYAVLSFQTEIRDYMYDYDLLFYALVAIACEDTDYDVIIKVVFMSFVILWIVILIRTLINEVQLVTDVGGLRTRISIGYGHGNGGIFAFIYMYLCLYYIYIRKNKILVSEIVFVFVINCVCFYICNLRGSFICVNIALLLSIILKYFKQCSVYFHIYKYLMYASVFFAIFMSLVLAIIYDPSNKVLVFLNKVLTGRLELSHDAILNTSFRLFGQITEFERVIPNWVYNVVDSSYLRFLITYGIIPFVFLIIQMLYFAHLIDIKKDIYLLFIFLIMQLRFITEMDFFPVMRYNYFFFIWSYYNSINAGSSVDKNGNARVLSTNRN